MVKDFERERASWEGQTKALIEEKKSMEEQLSQMKKDKTNLENQLKIQSQVSILPPPPPSQSLLGEEVIMICDKC